MLRREQSAHSIERAPPARRSTVRQQTCSCSLTGTALRLVVSDRHVNVRKQTCSCSTCSCPTTDIFVLCVVFQTSSRKVNYLGQFYPVFPLAFRSYSYPSLCSFLVQRFQGASVLRKRELLLQCFSCLPLETSTHRFHSIRICSSVSRHICSYKIRVCFASVLQLFTATNHKDNYKTKPMYPTMYPKALSVQASGCGGALVDGLIGQPGTFCDSAFWGARGIVARVAIARRHAHYLQSSAQGAFWRGTKVEAAKVWHLGAIGFVRVVLGLGSTMVNATAVTNVQRRRPLSGSSWPQGEWQAWRQLGSAVHEVGLGSRPLPRCHWMPSSRCLVANVSAVEHGDWQQGEMSLGETRQRWWAVVWRSC